MDAIEALMARTHRLEDGRWVSKEFQRIAGLIQETWNGVIELVWIPPETRSEADVFPYAVVENQRDGKRAFVMYLQEEEINHTLLARLFDMSSTTLEERLRNIELARDMVKMAEERERYEEMHDKANFLWRTPLHTVKMDGKEFHL